MFISDTDTDRKTNSKNAVIYLAFTAFCGFFSSVYGKFSHGVSSDYMVFLCLVPFIGGCVPYLILSAFNLKAPHNVIRQIYGSGIATLSVGFCLAGIFEIYGSECVYIPFYLYLGAILTIGAGIAYLIKH